MTDGHRIVLKFDMLGDVASIQERLKVLVGFAHDLNARQVGATIDPDDPDYKTRMTRAILDLRKLNEQYNPATALDIMHDADTLAFYANGLFSQIKKDIFVSFRICDDPKTASPDICKKCPNLFNMPDGGTMCLITKRSIEGAF